MSVISAAERKKPGPKPTGHRKMFGARLSNAFVAQIDEWARQRGVTRSDAIRQLIERGLSKGLATSA